MWVIFSVIVALVCILINVLILLQKKRSAGLTGNIAGMGATGTYWDKNRGRSREGKLEKYTKLTGALFMLLSLALNIIH